VITYDMHMLCQQTIFFRDGQLTQWTSLLSCPCWAAGVEVQSIPRFFSQSKHNILPPHLLRILWAVEEVIWIRNHWFEAFLQNICELVLDQLVHSILSLASWILQKDQRELEACPFCSRGRRLWWLLGNIRLAASKTDDISMCTSNTRLWKRYERV
jgi:hypothetical protein